MNVNLVVLGGHVVADAEIMRLGEKQTPLLKFSIAVNETRGEYKSVGFFNVQKWGEWAAENAHTFTKGANVIVQGRLVQNRWKTKDGQNRSIVLVDALQALVLSSEQVDQSGFEFDDEAPF